MGRQRLVGCQPVCFPFALQGQEVVAHADPIRWVLATRRDALDALLGLRQGVRRIGLDEGRREGRVVWGSLLLGRGLPFHFQTRTGFFDLFLEELKTNTDLHYYYKYLDNPSRFEYRKAYFCQRLQYIIDHINEPDLKIWDCGCGFGTTGIFLSINGIASHGTTLEHYIKQIPKRLEFWSQYGDVSKFTYSYEDIFDCTFKPESFDLIIIQDTLHF